jgi:hypothetical protein
MVQTINCAREAGDYNTLSVAHMQLAKLVAPARPGTIRTLEEEKNSGFGRFIGPIRLVRYLLMFAVVFLILFVVVATATNAGTESTHAATDPRGWTSVFVVLYLFSAAGLGATFAALWRVNSYVEQRTYDRSYDASYWILIVLGLIAGLILALVIPVKSVAGQPQLAKPLLALLGGFSASAVHRILDRLVGAVESLVQGDPKDAAQAMQAKAAKDHTIERTRVAAHLMLLDQTMANGGDPKAVRDQIHDLIASLVPEAALPTVAPPAPAANQSNGPTAPSANGNGSPEGAPPAAAIGTLTMTST